MKMIKTLQRVLLVLAVCLCPYYSFSEVINSNTNNAAKDAYVWQMLNLFPSQTGLEIKGVFHRYTLDKSSATNGSVVIKNKNASGIGNIYERIDNWDGIVGSTKVGYDPVTPSLRPLWGDGSIGVTGDGTLSDVTVHYHYSFDPCFIPLSDPSCPDFQANLYQYLLNNNLLDIDPNINDPYYDEWVKFQLDRKAEKQKEQKLKKAKEEKEKKEIAIEKVLAISGAVEKIADPAEQLNMLTEMAAVGKIQFYYDVKIEGGIYQDTIVLNDSNIKDNRRALRNLRNDVNHKSMVRSQYKD